jgi:hypothetical protein
VTNEAGLPVLAFLVYVVDNDRSHRSLEIYLRCAHGRPAQSVKLPYAARGARVQALQARTLVILPKRSWPAMSHSCSRMTLPSSQRMIFSAKSAPAPVGAQGVSLQNPDEFMEDGQAKLAGRRPRGFGGRDGAACLP